MCISLFLCVSCLKEGDETVVIPEIERNIPSDIVPDDIQEQFENNGFEIFEGTTPPNIEGTFKLSPLSLIFASDGYHADDFVDMYVTFGDQSERNTVSYSESQNDSVQGTAISAYVVGHDDAFTMYCYQYVTVPNSTWRCKIATVVSGKMAHSGIRECRYAYVLLEKESQNPNLDPSIAPERTYRIFVDADGLAERIE